MSDSHTAEPWRVDPENWMSIIDAATPWPRGLICQVNGKDRPEAEANARRMVACVNACAGIETEVLETLLEAGLTLDTNYPVVRPRLNEAEGLLTKAAHIINHPQKAGPKWATYSLPHVQKVVDDILDFLDRSKP